MTDTSSAPVTSARVLLVGMGKMGGALLSGWLDQGHAPDAITVVEPSQELHGPIVAKGVHAVTGAEAVPEGRRFDVVVLAVKPQVMGDIAPAYRPQIKAGACAISIAAGKTLAFFEDLFGPDAAIVRAMPNTPSAVGRGMTGLVANERVSAQQKIHAGGLMEGVGKAAWLPDETLMDALTAVSGSGPAYVFHMVEALANAGRAAGLPEDLALTLARQTIVGAGELLHRSDESAEQLRINVTSPNGVTAAGLEPLMDPDRGLPPLMKRVVEAAIKRNRELG